MNELIKAAQALVDSVSFDVNGKIIGDRWVGGHGGLVSKETLKLADACRRAIEEAKGGWCTIPHFQILDHDEAWGGMRARAEDEFEPVDGASGATKGGDSIFD